MEMTHTKLNTEWPVRPIGELLRRVRQPVDVQLGQTYQEIGIRSHCKGIFHKPPTTGEEIGNKRVFWVEPGCLIFNIIFAWEQAVAMTSENEAGMIASHRFPMYTSRNGKLLPEYAWRYFSSPRGKYDLGIASPGGAGRNKTLGQAEFDQLKIPVPPLSHQRMAVDTLAAADRAIALTEDLIEAKRKLKEGLAKLLLTGKHRLPDCKAQWCERSISDLAEVNPRTAKPPFLDTQVSFVPMANISEGGGLISPPVRPYRDVASGFTAFQDGDVLVSKITPCFENQKGALAQDLSNGYGFGTTELHVLRAKASCSARFLFYVSMSEGFRARGVANMTGSAGQRRVPTGFIQSYRLRVPSLPEQERIANVLSMADRRVKLLQTKLTALREIKRGLMQRLFADSTSEVRLARGEDRNAA
ncbi:MAG: restriction endonuclease subunit S [Gemmatimonadetes bacterium]|nr:restriction endonuclease subunit S [Gemmatimonadota bacterium]MYB70995.1 restriction endonuclease subunit S [Gemmatimonadota bacterium]